MSGSLTKVGHHTIEYRLEKSRATRQFEKALNYVFRPWWKQNLRKPSGPSTALAVVPAKTMVRYRNPRSAITRATVRGYKRRNGRVVPKAPHRRYMKRTSAYRPRLKRKRRSGGIRRKNHTKLNIGRDWPPSELRVTFSTNRQVDIGSGASSTTTGHLTALHLHTRIDDAGHFYGSNDATGTTDALAVLQPRNWEGITSLYRRARMVKTKHVVSIVMSHLVANENVALYCCWWYASTLDATNPIANLTGALGVAAPFSSADGFRDILLQSRRVNRRILRAPTVVSGGKAMYTFTFDLGNGLKDRYGNVAVGGHHVRDVTNNPGGINRTTDKTIALALTEEWGVNPAVNIICFELDAGGTILPKQYRIHTTVTLDLYDRIPTVQVVPP